MKRRDFCLAAIGACVFPFVPKRRRKLSERELGELVAAVIEKSRSVGWGCLSMNLYEYHARKPYGIDYWLRMK